MGDEFVSSDLTGELDLQVTARLGNLERLSWQKRGLQSTNPFTGETGVGNCPNLGSAGYTEVDMTECFGSSWCQFHVANPSFGIGNGCDADYVVDINWHTFTTVWNSSGITQYMDGVAQTTCNQQLSNPMFLLIQTQTGGVGGTPNNGYLPASLEVDYVKVTQP